jgi:hypothetical protein
MPGDGKVDAGTRDAREELEKWATEEEKRQGQ